MLLEKISAALFLLQYPERKSKVDLYTFEFFLLFEEFLDVAVLLDGRFKARGLFDAAHVENMVTQLDHNNSTVDRLWTLLILELWFREFIDAPAVAAAA